ncbi:MAG TPA: hypothetical protein VIF57_20795 [Polyangia bacterium]|jgi:hypothetical protein
MNRLVIIFCAAIAGAAAVAGCGKGSGGTAKLPFDPLGTERPGDGGLTPQPGRLSGTIEQLCAYDCTRLESICPGSGGGPDCAQQCVDAQSSFSGCETEFQAYLACVATAPITCDSVNGSLSLNGCDNEIAALSSCPLVAPQ